MSIKQNIKEPKYGFDLNDSATNPSSALSHEIGASTTSTPCPSSTAPPTWERNTNQSSRSTQGGSRNMMYGRPNSCRSTLSSSVFDKTPRSALQGGLLSTPAQGSARSHTPGSRRTPYTSSSGVTRDLSAVIVAIVEGRGLARGEIGMASLDLKHPVLVLSQFSDSQTYVKTLTKLHLLRPIEIVMPSTACDSGNVSKLFSLITDHYQNTNMATVPRKYFNEAKGLQVIRQLCLPEYKTVEMEVRAKYYCLATTAALLKYIEFIQNIVIAPNSLKVVFKGSEQTTMIDMATAVNLELLQNTRDPRSGHTLFGVLNHTKTKMGARLLRSNILQPPNVAGTINLRLDAVQELTEKEELFYNLRTLLTRFLDIEHLISLSVQIPKQETIKTAESKITNLIYLKHTLELVEPLKNALEPSVNPLLRAYYVSLQDERFKVIEDKINSVLNEETTYMKRHADMKREKCFAVRMNINGLLDVSRKVYTELLDNITDLVQELSEEHRLPLKVGYNSNRGFHIQIYCGSKNTAHLNKDSLPGVFIKVAKYKNTLSVTTLNLIKLNERTKLAIQEIYLMSNTVVTDMLTDIYQYFGCLYKLTECVSMLDMLLSFANNCTTSEYVRPDFTDTLAIKQGKHPVLEQISFETPVPNDVCASDGSNFVVITGPNMSGKSTYLRQIPLLQIMAQIGSFVPAQYASFRIADQIFSRIGSDDDIETNSSTFMLEMREINYIIQNASNNSLIIVDELGRGTSADEGVGICHSICEYLLNLKAFTFFATHFMEITKLGDLYPNVQNNHFEVQRVFSTDRGNSKVTYTHVLADGVTKESHYGIELAEVSTLPVEVVQNAKRLAKQLSAQRKVVQKPTVEGCRQQAMFKLVNQLKQVAVNSRLDHASLSTYLKSLKVQYHKDLQAAETLPGAGGEE